ncbi:MAG: hypothetical protein HYZ24_07970 [Chloroflexi bacterium]|nr:hypothetical protein [Chloroflexota bacterium]
MTNVNRTSTNADESDQLWFCGNLSGLLDGIVGRLEALSAETGRLEELKKSVLGKAFGGEL